MREKLLMNLRVNAFRLAAASAFIALAFGAGPANAQYAGCGYHCGYAAPQYYYYGYSGCGGCGAAVVQPQYYYYSYSCGSCGVVLAPRYSSSCGGCGAAVVHDRQHSYYRQPAVAPPPAPGCANVDENGNCVEDVVGPQVDTGYYYQGYPRYWRGRGYVGERIYRRAIHRFDRRHIRRHVAVADHRRHHGVR